VNVAERGPSGVEFRLLGPLEAVRDGVSLDLGPPKQRAALAALLLAGGRVVSTDRLIDAVWGFEPPPRALSSLQAYVSKLRSILQTSAGDEVQLIRRAPGYLLQTERVDLVEFRQLAEAATVAAADRQWAASEAAAGHALALWRGPLLADLADEEWVASDAVRLEEARALCLETLVTALLGQDRVADAAERVRELVDEHPLRERVRWLAMVALYRAGRSPEALDAFRDYASQLDEQLGLQPGPELRGLQTAILRQDPVLAQWPAKSQAVDVAASAAPLDETPAVPVANASNGVTRGVSLIVGRDDELATVDQLLADAVAGRERWLLLTGPAGIGKTRLAEETARRARLHGARIVWSSCPDDDGTPAWWPLRPLVRDLGGNADDVFLPPAGIDADTVRFQVYERLSTRLMQATAEAPLVVVIDDAQWLDAASSGCLAFLARNLRDQRLAVVLTMRDGERRAELEQLLAAFVRQDRAIHLAVPPLDATAAGSLLDQVSGERLPPSETFALIARTGSNPLLLTEYARLPRDERHDGSVPLAARSLLGRRLDRLSEEVLLALRAAAVVGDVFELGLLADVLGLSLVEVVDLLDLAAAEEIIRPAHNGQGYQFTHALLRDEVLLRLSVMRRQALHARIAEVLAERGYDARTLLRRAHHLTEALPIVASAVVVEACTAAALDAEQRWDWDIAAQQWGSALSALQLQPGSDQSARDELLVARLYALARAGRGQTVLDATDAGLDDAAREGRVGTIGRLAAVLLRTSGAWPWAAYGADPSALLARLTGLGSLVQSDPAAHARVLAALAVGNCYARDPALPDNQSREALEIAERLGDPDVLADALVGRVLAFVGIARHSERTIVLLERLHALPHALSRTDEVLRHNVLTMARFNRGQMDAVAEDLREGVTGSDHLRLPVTRVQFRWVEATLAQWHGDLDRSERLIARARDLHLQTELYSGDVTFRGAQLTLLWERGRVSSEPDAIEQSAEPLVFGALAAAELGELDRGRELVARRLAVDLPEYWYTLGYMTLLGHAAADLTDVNGAAALLEWLAPNYEYIAEVGQTACTGPVALATGRLRALLGDVDGARGDLIVAERLARAAAGKGALLRARLAMALLDAPAPQRSLTLSALADEAELIGMAGVAATARRAA
jgi:DNA-binding SARP family transcriptional activator